MTELLDARADTIAPGDSVRDREEGPVNVKELREALGSYPDDMEAILQEDAEGNGYSPLAGAESGMYEAETTWSGEVIHEGDYNPDDSPDAVKVLVLWPVN